MNSHIYKVMPYRRRPYRNRRRRRALPTGLATRPRFIPRALKMKRYQAVDTKVFYFKIAGKALPDLDGKYFTSFNSRQLTQDPQLFPQFTALKDIYDQFKCLAVKIRFFPANVGVEPDSAFFTSNALLRGQTLVYNDQRADNIVAPTNVLDVINNASTRMIPSRKPFSRTIFRAKGYPEWGNIQATATDDSWNGSINVYIQDATPATVNPAFAPTLWYWTASYKVVFRGRRTE